jgi:hypothetical protein
MKHHLKHHPKHHLAALAFAVALGLALALAAPSAAAKLPAPSEEAKAKAAEAAAKAAHGNKVADFQLCKAQDRVAALYQAEAKKSGKEVKAPVETKACTDPGPFEPKPIEVSGAHSPPATAVAPPSTTMPAASAPGSK